VAFDAFLKLDGIPGDSVDAVHKGEIEITGIQGGLTHSVNRSSATGGAGAGKATFQDFHFIAPVSSATPKLILACASGQHIKTATVTMRKAGGEQRGIEFLKYALTDVLVSSVTTGGSTGDAEPTEQFSLSFLKLNVVYTPQKPDGTTGPPVTSGWDLSTNKQA
jgi:type VI secretion system secreted protein Hcp